MRIFLGEVFANIKKSNHFSIKLGNDKRPRRHSGTPIHNKIIGVNKGQHQPCTIAWKLSKALLPHLDQYCTTTLQTKQTKNKYINYLQNSGSDFHHSKCSLITNLVLQIHSMTIRALIDAVCISNCWFDINANLHLKCKILLHFVLFGVSVLFWW